MVHLRDVSKYYGQKRALGPVSLDVEEGATVGCLGLNGVGKTTLLRILACGLRPSSGTVEIAGLNVLEQPHEVRKRVGYLPELPPVYGDMPVGEYLAFVGRIKGLPAAGLADRIAEVEHTTHLEEVHHVPTRHLSQGYRQRVGVAQAIIHDPDLLILDEPTHDLDPVQIVEMRELIRNLQGSRTLLISSHILPEISQTCDRLLILNDGRIVASGDEADLRARFMKQTVLEVSVATGSGPGGHTVESLLGSVQGVVRVTVADRGADEVTYQVYTEGDVRAPVCRALVEGGWEVVALGTGERELENLFVGLVGAGSPRAGAEA
ncbi:MAG: ABC transporter ATP-binding protein [Gemmatimonadetes bacterium]|nr:ABC transporter ATP-binding protein [Gemmatimonadota bacterium]